MKDVDEHGHIHFIWFGNLCAMNKCVDPLFYFLIIKLSYKIKTEEQMKVNKIKLPLLELSSGIDNEFVPNKASL